MTPSRSGSTVSSRADLNALPNTPYYSDLTYSLKQYAFFGEGTWFFTPQWSLTGGLRYYNFEEDRVLNFGGYFAEPTPPGGVPGKVDSDGVSPRVILTYSPTEDLRFNAQFSRGFRLGGINDPINIPLCSPQDIAIFGGQAELARRDGEELRARRQDAVCRAARDAERLRVLQRHQGSAGDHDGGHVLLAHRVQRAEVAQSRRGDGAVRAAERDDGTSGSSATYLEAELRSSVSFPSPAPRRRSWAGSRKAIACRRPRISRGSRASGSRSRSAESRDLFANFTVQHVGQSFSQFENEVPNFGLICQQRPRGLGATSFPTGRRLCRRFAFDTELPSYEMGNLRVGVRSRSGFELAAFVNNLWDEEARPRARLRARSQCPRRISSPTSRVPTACRRAGSSRTPSLPPAAAASSRGG